MILVIEDNAPSMELMTYLLGAFGHDTRRATTGEDGLAAAARERPSLILCDVHLPGIDGCEVARSLKSDAALRDVPLIAVTALAMVGDRERVLAAGFDSYIPKPIVPETFVGQVEAFLPAAAPPGARALILVVDNSPVNLELARSLLVPHGLEVVAGSGLAEGCRLAREHRPDLILSDVHMGDGMGFDLLTLVKGDPDLRNIPVVLISSSYSDGRERERALQMGAAQYLFRPIEAAELLAEIRSCLEAAQRGYRGQSAGRR